MCYFAINAVLILEFRVIFKPITIATWYSWRQYCGCIIWFYCRPLFKTTGYE